MLGQHPLAVWSIAADYLVSDRYPGVRSVCNIGPWPNVRAVYGPGCYKCPGRVAMLYVIKNEDDCHARILWGLNLVKTEKINILVSGLTLGSFMRFPTLEVGRVNDGLAMSQGPMHDEDDDKKIYKKHAEFLLHGSPWLPWQLLIPPSLLQLHGKEWCLIRHVTLCDVSYPRKLAFHGLQDLQKEFGKIDLELVNQITEPYSFLKFDNIICNIRRQYVDTRTQANLSKLNNHRKAELDVHTEQMSIVVERRRKADLLGRMMKARKSTSPVWGSKTLEVITVKWTPSVTIIFVLAFVLLWSSFKS
nr:25.3 kDa vesicle transport protein [Tanacetum cinerariifolium]